MTTALDRPEVALRTPRSRVATAAALSAPLILFLLVPNVVTLFTLSAVGRLGEVQLAGMGVANAIFGMLLALLYGFDTGVQAIAARATGAGAPEVARQALLDGLAGSVLCAAGLTALLWFQGPALIALLSPDPATVASGGALLRGLALSLLLLGATMTINSYWIGTGAAQIPFLVQVALVPVQIGATFALVLGLWGAPQLGTFGAGLASSLACACGLMLQIVIARRRGVPLLGRPQLRGVIAIVRIGWPVSVQQSLALFGFTLAYAIVARLGVSATAMLNVLGSLTMVPIQAATGIGNAAATLVGQALGRGDTRDAARWGWQLSFAAALLFLPAGLFAVLRPQLLLGAFLHDPNAIAAAVLPVQILGAGVAIDTFARVLNFALRGAGATRPATAIPFVIQWLIQLPLMWVVGIRLGMGMTGVVAVQVGLTLFEAMAFAFVWRREGWARVHFAGLDDAEQAAQTRAAPQRVLVMGGAGAGKSTLARDIGAKLGLPVIHLDRIMFGPNWTRVAPEAAREQLRREIEGGYWVIDGTYPAFYDITLRDADLVVWIGQPVPKRLWRAWRKTRIHKNAPRADRPDGCEEGFGLSSVWTVLRFGRLSSAREWQLRSAANGRVVHLRGDRAVRQFLETLPSN
jgi:putative MATE family efflux protein